MLPWVGSTGCVSTGDMSSVLMLCFLLRASVCVQSLVKKGKCKVCMVVVLLCQ